MGTRSLTILKDAEKEIAVMYRQYDGYPEGHGKELAEYLAPMIVVNGFNSQPRETTANGGDCLAAKVVCHFKADSPLGGIYLHPAGTRDCGEEYVYTVEPREGRVWMTCADDERVFWEGFASDFDAEAAVAAMERLS